MTLLLNFATAAAAIWGGLMAIGFIAAVLSGGSKSAEDAADFIRKGFLCWAWLIARYCL